MLDGTLPVYDSLLAKVGLVFRGMPWSDRASFYVCKNIRYAVRISNSVCVCVCVCVCVFYKKLM